MSESEKKSIDYNAPPTLRQFHQSNAFARFIIGPYGSGKTFGMVMETLRRAVEQKPDYKKERNTKFVIIRNTGNQLRQTVLPDIRQILGPIVRYKVSDMSLHFDFSLPDGTKVKSEWLMLPIEDTEDQRRLLSLQLTGAWLAEFRELRYDIVAAVAGRVGRYPSMALGGPSWSGIYGESNPFAEGTDWYNHLVLDLPSNWAFFHQPGGRSPEAENIENLPPGYYEQFIEGHAEDWVKVHVDAQFGDDLSGQSVFGRIFNKHTHTTTERLNPIPNLPLMIGMDFGRTPTALIGQVDTRGRILVFKEILGENMGIEQFASEKLTPILRNRFSGHKFFVVGDPAGRQKSQVNEESVFDVLNRLGFSTVAASTNDVQPRLIAVESNLLKVISGTPMVLIQRDECPQLVRALMHDYKYERKKTGRIDDIPCKSHPASDLADAFQYMCLSVNSPKVGRMISGRRSAPPPPRFSKRAWT
jgi:hypothetical protein